MCKFRIHAFKFAAVAALSRFFTVSLFAEYRT